MLTKEDLLELVTLVEKEIRFHRNVHTFYKTDRIRELIQSDSEDKVIKYERLKIKLIDLLNEEDQFRPEVSE